jgi:hypothetical protein
MCISYGSGKELHDTTALSAALAECPDASIEWTSVDLAYEPCANTMFNCMPYIHSEQSTFLQATFPNANLVFNRYATVAAYIQELDAQRIFASDIVCAIDLNDSDNEKNKTYNWYCYLCAKTLLHNPDAQNFLFAAQSVEGSLKMVVDSYSLEQTEHSLECPIELPDIENIPSVYKTTAMIKYRQRT